ncbi:protein FAM124B isoform X2 [Thalassophryne amazonica]|uniref:protein FAM124B isoform X2 n=1 Tax=Thalassophryne amazonica TaxID=390379 RepID=UPI00147167F1|nr:protein FAM124B isoform X2 [Thalassophryne amazonica]
MKTWILELKPPIEDLTRRFRRRQQQQQLLLMNLHVLANPGDSLLLQHTLDRLLRWLCPSLRIFHVSERASPFKDYTRSHLCPVAGYPSLSITFFLHEVYGEERILRVLDFFQRPPWQYHHTESCGSQTGGVHITSSSSKLRPYLLPSRDFYSLGDGMPVWGVRPVHCGGEILRVTLYSGYDNYEDEVRLYETVLQQQAQEQKTGFCWFTLHTEPGLCLQLALKQLPPGVRVEPCSSAVLQFSVEEIGQLVPLLPNPCTPISTTRWQTEDLDGNKVLFQVKTPAHPQRPLTCAFPLTFSAVSPRGMQLRRSSEQSRRQRSSSPTSVLPWKTQGDSPRSDTGVELLQGGGGAESLGSGSCCSTHSSSSCYSSQRSSPAPPPTSNHRDSPLRPSITCSLSHLLLEEDEEESETNVDTGVPVTPQSDSAVAVVTSSPSVDVTVSCEQPAAFRASAEGRLKELSECLAWTHTVSQGTSRTAAAISSPSKGPKAERDRTTAEPLNEFFI